MPILITGSTGMLGKELTELFPDSLTPSHEEFDITNKESVIDFFKNNSIDLVIHAAALTKVRTCEENKSLAWNTHVEGTRNLVHAIEKLKLKIPFVYMSTACVFDGHAEMYDENSIPYPKNFYALTKLIGEREVIKLSENLIIRTNFVGKKKWSYPKAFTDRFGTFLFSKDVAYAIKEVIQEKLTGVIHITGDKIFSMFELAKMTTNDIEPITISEYSGPTLTMNMTLNTIRWKKYKIGFSFK